MPDQYKRETAYKLRIGDLLKANQIFEQSENLNPRLQFVELGDKKILRINIIGNIVDKFESEGEKRFASITLDDGSGQIRARLFGEETEKFKDLTQGDTILIIGMLRSYNQEIYILPEILRKAEPKYLLVRKLEIEKQSPKPLSTEQKQEVKALRDEVIDKIKAAEAKEGIDKGRIEIRSKGENLEEIYFMEDLDAHSCQLVNSTRIGTQAFTRKKLRENGKKDYIEEFILNIQDNNHFSNENSIPLGNYKIKVHAKDVQVPQDQTFVRKKFFGIIPYWKEQDLPNSIDVYSLLKSDVNFI